MRAVGWSPRLSLASSLGYYTVEVNAVESKTEDVFEIHMDDDTIKKKAGFCIFGPQS